MWVGVEIPGEGDPVMRAAYKCFLGQEENHGICWLTDQWEESLEERSGQLCFALEVATLNEIRFDNVEVMDNHGKGTLEERWSQTWNQRADKKCGKLMWERGNGSMLYTSLENFSLK